MTELSAPVYQFARFALERGLGAIYLVAFIVAARQFAPLLGEALACLALGQEPPVPRSRFSLGRPALRLESAVRDRPR